MTINHQELSANKSNSFSKEKQIFEDIPVPKAVAAMALPTIVSQIIFVIYNLADTWYVGLTENANAVAAISLCLPVYTILSAISNLFGIGGAAIISRALGTKNHKTAKEIFALSVWGAFAVAVVYSALIHAGCRPLLNLIGGDAGDMEYAVSYLHWAVVIGGISTILAPTLAHLLRAGGFSKAASCGMILGAVLNIGLDPLFMFVLLPHGNEVTGAAMATALSNFIALVWFLCYLPRHRHGSYYSVKLSGQQTIRTFLPEILGGGMPSFLMIAMAMLSNCFLNAMLSTLGSAAVAGVGLVRKIDQLAYAVNQGITQGMLPLVAYCYASNRRQRMYSIVKFSAICSEGFSFVCTALSLLLAPQLIQIFIRDTDTVHFGAAFLRVICLAVPVYTMTFVIIAIFQAVGRHAEPFFISILHKGTLDIALMLLIFHFGTAKKIVWATPVSETLALAVAVILLLRLIRKKEKKEDVK